MWNTNMLLFTYPNQSHYVQLVLESLYIVTRIKTLLFMLSFITAAY